MSVPPLPHAAIAISAIDNARSIQASFSGPTGAACVRSALGSVERSAKRLTIKRSPASRRFANPMHLLIVGSSKVASAVDGFSPMKATTRSENPIWRESRYRYWPQSDRTAAGRSMCNLISRWWGRFQHALPCQPSLALLQRRPLHLQSSCLSPHRLAKTRTASA